MISTLANQDMRTGGCGTLHCRRRLPLDASQKSGRINAASSGAKSRLSIRTVLRVSFAPQTKTGLFRSHGLRQRIEGGTNGTTSSQQRLRSRMLGLTLPAQVRIERYKLSDL